MKKTILCLALFAFGQVFAGGYGSGGSSGGSDNSGGGSGGGSNSGSTSGAEAKSGDSVSGVRMGDVIAESGDSSAGARVDGVSADARVGDTTATGGKSNSKATVGNTTAKGGNSKSTVGNTTSGSTSVSGGGTSSAATGAIRVDPSQYLTSSPTATSGNVTGTTGPSTATSITGPSSSTTGAIHLDPSQYSTQNATTGASTSSTGAINNSSGGGAGGNSEGGDSVSNSTSAGGGGGTGGGGGAGGQINQSTKYFNVTFPEPVSATAIAAGNCGASYSGAMGWNFFSFATSSSNKAAECRLLPLIVVLYNQCQYETGGRALHETTRGALKEATGVDIGEYKVPTGVSNWAQCLNGTPQTTRTYTEAELTALLAMGAKPTNVTIYNDGSARSEAKADAKTETEEAHDTQCQSSSQMGAIIAGKPYKPAAKTGGCDTKKK